MSDQPKKMAIIASKGTLDMAYPPLILATKNVPVRVKLYKGNIMVAGRKSPVSLYNPAIATMEADPTKAYNQDDATGFIRLNALRLKVAAKVHRRKK